MNLARVLASHRISKYTRARAQNARLTRYNLHQHLICGSALIIIALFFSVYSGLSETAQERTESEETATGAIGPGDQEAHTVGRGSQSHGSVLGTSQGDHR